MKTTIQNETLKIAAPIYTPTGWQVEVETEGNSETVAKFFTLSAADAIWAAHTFIMAVRSSKVINLVHPSDGAVTLSSTTVNG